MLPGSTHRKRKRRRKREESYALYATLSILLLVTLNLVRYAFVSRGEEDEGASIIGSIRLDGVKMRRLVNLDRTIDRGDKNATIQSWKQLSKDLIKGAQDPASRKEIRDQLLPKLQERLKNFMAGRKKSRSTGKNDEELRDIAQLVDLTLDDIYYAGLVADCPTDPTLPKSPFNGKKLFLASNLHENEPLMPHYVYMLLVTVLKFERMEDVYISIYESGSQDKTAEWLAFLRILLDVLQVKSVILSDPKQRKPEEGRIKFLASCRNKILEPFFAQNKMGNRYDKLVFINDVYFCADHIPRLLQHDADLACGVDLTRTPPFESLLFYDVWVARDATGHMFSNFPPYVEHSYSRMRIEFGFPFPAHCCWNGLAVLNPSPFLKDGIRFRSHEEGECAASECSLICKDFYLHGYRTVVVDPAVRVAYAREDQDVAYDLLVNVPYTTWHDTQDWPIDWAHVPRKTHVLCCPLKEEKEEVEFDSNPWAVVRQDCYTEHLD